MKGRYMMEGKMQVLHIVNRDKFSSGYINFMKVYMTEYEHAFVLKKDGFELELVDSENVYFVDELYKMFSDNKVANLLKNAEKIIYSGVFSKRTVMLMPSRLIRKTYFHFWGGDFYCFRDEDVNVRDRLRRIVCYKQFKKCAGSIFLIDGEDKAFKEITGISTKSFLAPMPMDPNKTIDLHCFNNNAGLGEKLRIILGNSATKENCHKEALDKLACYKGENFEVICPLSYGDEEYGEEIAVYGKKLLGEKFIPITEFMAKEKYVELLSSCSVGIFNNDRQQAMGNINMLLVLGKKVFLRENTSMWKTYNDAGYEVSNINQVGELPWAQLIAFRDESKINNIKIRDEMSSVKRVAEKWQAVFDDCINEKHGG